MFNRRRQRLHLRHFVAIHIKTQNLLFLSVLLVVLELVLEVLLLLLLLVLFTVALGLGGNGVSLFLCWFVRVRVFRNQ